jgi:hypothetical protein
MGVGSGDGLASGRLRKKNYGPLEVSEEKWKQAISRRKKEDKKPWGWCADCGFAAMTGEEWSEHIRVCERNPLP